MSIADKLTSIENHLTDDYNALTRLGADLSNVDKNIENIADVCDAIYNATPKVTDTGSNLTLTPTRKGGLIIVPKGACEQDTTAYIDVGTWEQGTISSTGTEATSEENIRTKEYIPVKPNVLYNISRSIYDSYNAYRFYDNSKNYLGYQSTEGMVTTNRTNDGNRMLKNITSMTMTINNTNVAYMRIIDNSNDLSTQYTISTQAPTPDYPQDIKVVTGDNSVVVSNKNLLNGYWKQGDALGNSQGTRIHYVQNIFIKNGTKITFSNDLDTNTMRFATQIFSVPVYDNSGNVITTSATRIFDSTWITNNSYTYTATQDCYVTLLVSYINNASIAITNVQNNKFMLEYGSTATTYVAHAEQTYTLHLGTEYLAGIGTYDDEIEGKPGEWKIKREVGKTTKTGVTATSTNDLYFSQFSGYLNQQGYCSHFKVIENSLIVNNSNAGTRLNDGECAFRDGETKDRLYYKTTKTKEQIDALSKVIYYVLATPTEETITNQTLITDLNNIYYAMGYDGTTNITITSSNAQMIAQVSALKGE